MPPGINISTNYSGVPKCFPFPSLQTVTLKYSGMKNYSHQKYNVLDFHHIQYSSSENKSNLGQNCHSSSDKQYNDLITLAITFTPVLLGKRKTTIHHIHQTQPETTQNHTESIKNSQRPLKMCQRTIDLTGEENESKEVLHSRDYLTLPSDYLRLPLTANP